MATVKVLVTFNIADEGSKEWENDEWGNTSPEEAGYTILQEVRRRVEHMPEGFIVKEKLTLRIL